MSDTEAETPPEYRRLDREALGRLLDQWIPWLDPKRPNRLTATTLADALWGAAWPATGPAELDVEAAVNTLMRAGFKSVAQARSIVIPMLAAALTGERHDLDDEFLTPEQRRRLARLGKS